MDDTTKNIVYHKNMNDNIETNNMSKLRAMARDRKLRGYSRMRKSELINYLKTGIKDIYTSKKVYEKVYTNSSPYTNK